MAASLVRCAQPLGKGTMTVRTQEVAGSVPVRLIAAGLYNNPPGSLLLVGLCHASLGAVTGAVVLPYLVLRWANLTFEIYGAIGVLALLLIPATRGKLS